MRLLHNISLRRKQMVIIMLVSTVALLFACAGFVGYNVLSFRREMVQKTSVLAEVVANTCTGALDFNDPKFAEQALRALRAEPGLVAACVYDRNGGVFAVYNREGAPAFTPPPFSRWAKQEFSGNFLRLYRPVQAQGDYLGTVFLESDLTELRQRLMQYPLIVSWLFAASLLAAFIISTRLQRIICNPILHLAQVARSVALDKNYSVRAVKQSSDELGQLIDGFNEMLTQIQERDTALRSAHDNLEQRVRARTAELANSLSLLNATLEATGDGIVAVDLSGRIVCYNNKFAAMWHVPAGVLETGSHEEFLAYSATLVKNSDRYLARIKELSAHPEAEVLDVLELGGGQVFERLIRPQRTDQAVVGRVLNFRDITERKRSELRLEEAHRELVQASRQAGMAEVATSVLHNVGNVLTSVNTSASVVLDRLKKSKMASISLVAGLLREHANDLGDFMTRDPKGQQLPAYLDQLSGRLADEQAFLTSELEQLKKHIEHINQIVAMQQNYARAGGVTETVKPTELVEDALRMNADALARHDVKVVREFDPSAPDITVEKHKVLQVLVNLIRNAKYACDESGRDEKRLNIVVARATDRVRITVVDNGVGIPKENLLKIFNHGFTTRKDGHGFGLHSGALAAREIGGALVAHSDGPGLGASFTLELPLQPKKQIT